MTDGGGGTFANIWTPSTFAQAGFYVSDTRTPGHVYQMSLEHHVRTECAQVQEREQLGPVPRRPRRGHHRVGQPHGPDVGGDVHRHRPLVPDPWSARCAMEWILHPRRAPATPSAT